MLMDAGQRVSDVNNDTALIHRLHGDLHSTDVALGETSPL